MRWVVLIVVMGLGGLPVSGWATDASEGPMGLPMLIGTDAPSPFSATDTAPQSGAPASGYDSGGGRARASAGALGTSRPADALSSGGLFSLDGDLDSDFAPNGQLNGTTGFQGWLRSSGTN